MKIENLKDLKVGDKVQLTLVGGDTLKGALWDVDAIGDNTFVVVYDSIKNEVIIKRVDEVEKMEKLQTEMSVEITDDATELVMVDFT